MLSRKTGPCPGTVTEKPAEQPSSVTGWLSAEVRCQQEDKQSLGKVSELKSLLIVLWSGATGTHPEGKDVDMSPGPATAASSLPLNAVAGIFQSIPLAAFMLWAFLGFRPASEHNLCLPKLPAPRVTLTNKAETVEEQSIFCLHGDRPSWLAVFLFPSPPEDLSRAEP